MNWPVIAIDRFCWPCCPELGLSTLRAGVPAVTVKAFVSVSDSAFVVTVMLRAPVVAEGSIFISAVAVVGELTVNETVVIPGPKFAVVVL